MTLIFWLAYCVRGKISVKQCLERGNLLNKVKNVHLREREREREEEFAVADWS